MGGLGDQHDHGKVIEKLKRADHALAWLLPVRTERLPQGAAQPGPALPAGGHATDGRVSIQLTISRRSANSHWPSCLTNSSR